MRPGTVHTVRTRTIGAWADKLGHPGPHLCLSCAKVAIRQVMAAWEQRVAMLAAETTPNGRRSSVVAEWVADNHRKVLV